MAQRQDDNFVWNDEQPEVIQVRAIEPLRGFTVRLHFTNGEVRKLDLKPHLRGPMLEPLRRDQ